MRYHKSIYWPSALNRLIPHGVKPIAYTHHARAQADNDRFILIPLPRIINLNSLDIFEAELDVTGRLCKIVGQTPIDTMHTASYAIGIERNGSLFVKTVWANRIHDRHDTLNRNLYAAT